MHRKCIAKHIINPRISALWSTTKRLLGTYQTLGRTPYAWSPGLRGIIPGVRYTTYSFGLLGLGVLFNCFAHGVSTTKQIAQFSCRKWFIHLSPGLLGGQLVEPSNTKEVLPLGLIIFFAIHFLCVTIE